MDTLEVIYKYHGLKQIGDQFCVMKGAPETRPMYVRAPEHIEAHLLICLTALIVTRVIRKRAADHEIDNTGKKDKLYWSYAICAERPQAALNKWRVETLPGGLYRFPGLDDPGLKRIIEAFENRIPRKLYRRGELRHLRTSAKIFTQVYFRRRIFSKISNAPFKGKVTVL